MPSLDDALRRFLAERHEVVAPVRRADDAGHYRAAQG
jgi:hypothetical protein